MAVSFKMFLHLPPVMGMMTGMSLLMIYGYRLKILDYHFGALDGGGETGFDAIDKVRDASLIF